MFMYGKRDMARVRDGLIQEKKVDNKVKEYKK